MASVTLRIRSFGLVWPTNTSQRAVERFIAFLLSWSEGKTWLRDETNLRFSLLGCARLSESVVYGVLAQEHFIERHLYTDDKTPSRDEFDSYEDRFFLLDVQELRVTLDWRRFFKKAPLNLPRTMARLQFTLDHLWRLSGNEGNVVLAPIFHETSKGEFIELFYENRTLSVEATGIGTEEVPEDVQLVNPNRHLEGTLRQLLKHDYEHNSLDRVQAEVFEDSGGDLRRSAITRGIIHSGFPRRLRFQSPTGYIRVRSETENGIQSISIPTTDLDSAEDRAYIAAIVVGAARGIDIPLVDRPQREKPPEIDNFDLFNV